MGCGGSKEEEQAPPPRKTGGYSGPKQLTPEEIEKKKREEEEEKKWLEEAKRVGPPAPKKPVYNPGATEDEYKAYMQEKYNYEAWENEMIRLGRKLRAEAKA